jgi:hypothetical protein
LFSRLFGLTFNSLNLSSEKSLRTTAIRATLLLLRRRHRRATPIPTPKIRRCRTPRFCSVLPVLEKRFEYLLSLKLMPFRLLVCT